MCPALKTVRPEMRPALAATARRLSRFALLLAGMIPLAIVIQFLFFDPSLFPVPYGMASLLADLAWDGSQRLLGAVVALLPASGVTVALLAAARICREYAKGGLFSDAVLAAYRRLGIALAATTLLHWVHPTLLGLALALTLPPGKRFVTVGVSSDDLLMALVTGLVFLLGAVMQVAQEVQADNAEIV